MHPFLDRSRARYDSLGGALYDGVVARPAIAALGARALWGADIGVFFAPMEAVANAPAGIAILDVPCGGGVVLERLPVDRGIRYVAVDHSPKMLARAGRVAAARGLTGVEFVEADVGALPCADGTFDLCISSAGLHCFPDPARAVREMARCLKPGGSLVGSMAVAGAGARHDAVIAVFRRLAFFGTGGTEDDLRRWLGDAGLDGVTVARSGALVHFTGRATPA